MPQESRVKKSLLNARVNLIFYFLTLALSFFSRKIFLETLGPDFIGLTGTLQNLLGFLNLAELGVSTAIGYVLYKPLFQHDEAKIVELISVLGYLYRWIGFLILGIGALLACFLPLIYPNTKFDLSIIYFVYFSFLASSLIGYFANYKQTLLGADQKNYVVTAYFQITSILKILIQILFAYYTRDYYVWVVFELIFGIVYSIILNKKINQVYPWLKTEVKQGKRLFKKYSEVTRHIRQLFVHQIGSFVQFQTTPLLIYAFVSLQLVAYYGNYTILLDKLILLINNVLGSTAAGVGNLIAEGNESKIRDVFWELTTIRFWTTGIILFSLYHLTDPFIILWLGEQYVLDHSILILILLSLFTREIHGCLAQFLYGYGLFKDIWAPILQACIFLVISVFGGYYYGLQGILAASSISIFCVVGIWKPYFLYKYGFKIPVKRYWSNWFLHMFLIVLSIIASSFVLKTFFIFSIYSVSSWLFYACVITAIYVIISFILMIVFIKSMRRILKRVIR